MVITAIILAILTIFLSARVGAEADYNDKGFSADLVICGYKKKLYPREKKDKEGQQEKTSEKQKKKPEYKLRELAEPIKSAINSVKIILRKMSLDYLRLRYTAAGEDPYDVAMKYSVVNALYYGVRPYVKKHDVIIDSDYNAEESRLEVRVTATMSMFRFAEIAIATLFSYLKVYIKRKSAERHERNTPDGKQTQRHDAVHDTQYQKSC